jgi:cysteine synthase B
MGVSRYLKEKNSRIRVIGVQPTEGSSIPGIRRWPKAYIPKIFDESRVDQVIDVSQQEAESMSRRLAAEEGVFCGISSGGAVAAALQLQSALQHALIVTIICDRGDRYVSTGVYNPT